MILGRNGVRGQRSLLNATLIVTVVAPLAMQHNFLVAQSAAVDTVVKHAGVPVRPELGQLVYDGVTIGQLEGAPEYTFSRIAQIIAGVDGSVYILDAPPLGTSAIRQYDASGKYLRSIGRTGDGPGEFRYAAGMALLADGRLIVVDGMNSRINVYAPNGAPLQTWPGSFKPTVNSSQAVTVSAAGIIAIVTHLPMNLQQQMAGVDTRVIVRLRPDGSVLDTLTPPKTPNVRESYVTKRLEQDGRVSTYGTRVPYLPDTLWFWSPLGYFVIGRADSYAIDLIQPEKPVLRITRTVPRVPVTDEERADQKAHHQRLLDSAPGKQVGTLRDVPPVKPHFRSIQFDATGRLCVWVATPSERFTPPPQRDPNDKVIPRINWRSPRRYDLFEPDGTYVGQFAAPDEVGLKFIRGDEVWGVVRDEFDVEYAKRFRIVWK